jgi:hypothetical protein
MGKGAAGALTRARVPREACDPNQRATLTSNILSTSPITPRARRQPCISSYTARQQCLTHRCVTSTISTAPAIVAAASSRTRCTSTLKLPLEFELG